MDKDWIYFFLGFFSLILGAIYIGFSIENYSIFEKGLLLITGTFMGIYIWISFYKVIMIENDE